MDKNKKERERERKLNILLFRETKPHDVSRFNRNGKEESKETELNDTTS